MNWAMKKRDQEKDFKHKNFQDKKRENIQTTHNPIMVYMFLTDTSFDRVHSFVFFFYGFGLKTFQALQRHK